MIVTPSVAARWTYRGADEDPFPETLDLIDCCALLVGGDPFVQKDVKATRASVIACYLVVATCSVLFAR